MPIVDGVWKPTHRQEKLLSVPDTVKEAALLGGAGSGKSELLLMYGVVNRWHENPAFKQLFTRRTFPELKNEIVPRSRLIYPKFGGKFNKFDMVWTFESGATIYFGHCQHEDDVQKYDSMEINLYTPDEITSYLFSQYMYIGFTRVRASQGSGLPAIIRGAGMPGGIGHTWVKNRFIKPFPSGGKILIGPGGNKRIFIFATSADNPHIDPNYAQSLEALPEAEKQAKKYGSFDSYDGQVFEEFRDRKITGEPDNALHIVEPFDIPKWWPKICAIDWGFSAMCSVGWAAISPNKRIYVYRHQMFFKEKIEEWAPKVKVFVDKDEPGDIVICHSANQHRGDPHTILEQVSSALGLNVRLGEKNRISGKLLLHEFLRWQKIPPPGNTIQQYDHELANWLLRNKGESAYKDYNLSFAPITNDEVLPKLLFFRDHSVAVICDAIKACIYEKSAADGKKKEDVAEFDGDDPYDMLRMLLHAADIFFSTANKEQARLNQVQNVINRFDSTQDMTSYYIQMRKIEAAQVIKPVRLFHRGKR